MQEILLTSSQISPGDLKHALSQEYVSDDEITLEIRQSARRLRGVEPAVLVAIVGAAGTALGALVAGVLRLAQDKGSQKIIIVGRSGARIEIPASTQPEMLDKYVDMAKGLDIERIHL